MNFEVPAMVVILISFKLLVLNDTRTKHKWLAHMSAKNKRSEASAGVILVRNKRCPKHMRTENFHKRQEITVWKPLWIRNLDFNFIHVPIFEAKNGAKLYENTKFGKVKLQHDYTNNIRNKRCQKHIRTENFHKRQEITVWKPLCIRNLDFNFINVPIFEAKMVQNYMKTLNFKDKFRYDETNKAAIEPYQESKTGEILQKWQEITVQ